MKLPLPTFSFEQTHWEQGVEYVAGVDEVGRGAFAGPVVTAAVIFPRNCQLSVGIHDSKLLTPQKRKGLVSIIEKYALAYTIAEVSVERINEIGVGKATQQAFRECIMTSSVVPEHILMDAFYIDSIDPMIQTPIIKGDQKSISIAAASILAKVYRDELMERLSNQYANYDFKTNKGYGTKKHREMINMHGLCNLHRTSFNLSKFLS